MPRFNQSLIVITGGAQGIGLAAARHLASLGANLALIDLNREMLDHAEKELAGHGGSVRGFKLNVCDRDAMFATADTIETELGPVSGLLTCAGITSPAASAAMDTQTWRRVLDVNLDGTFFACQAFGVPMLKRLMGTIVTVSSVLGVSAQAGRANYIASKWAVVGLTKALANEWGPDGVRVNCIAPGPVRTPLFEKMPTEFREGLVIARTPMGRVAEPDELGKVAAFLLSEDSSFVNGAVLAVDGGYTTSHATDLGGRDGRAPASPVRL